MSVPRRTTDPEPIFNPPAVMLARLVFLASLISVAGTLSLLGVGVLLGDAAMTVAGASGFAVAWLTRRALEQRAWYRAAERAFDGWSSSAAADAPQLTRLLDLLRDWEALEEKRGSRAFDPWALQVVRNDIHALVEADPALASVVERYQRAA